MPKRAEREQESSSSSKAPRRYGFACTSCRRRKIRCDGDKPICRRCRVAGRGAGCVYKSAEAVEMILRQQIDGANDRVKFLEEQIKRLPEADPLNREQIIQELCNSIRNHASDEQEVMSPVDEYTNGDDLGDSAGGTVDEVTFDEEGKVQVFGSTSLFYLPLGQDTASPASRRASQIDEQQHRQWLETKSQSHEFRESAAWNRLQSEEWVDVQTASRLLHFYWTWQHPGQNFIYRPCFFRDMESDGPYFNTFLLYAVLAHASRQASASQIFLEVEKQGEEFLERAMSLLYAEMRQPEPKPATVQALLVLSEINCIRGHVSQGWLYLGMAVRILKHIGFHISPMKACDLDSVSAADLEARKRLFHSTYNWDMIVSLSYGRLGCLSDNPSRPDSLWDTSDDEEDWTPQFLSVDTGYLPGQSHGTSTFISTSRLAAIMHDLYEALNSGSKNSTDLAQSAQLIEERLRNFYRDLPGSVRIDDASSATFCPPLHIFNLNILYHTMIILCYRSVLWSPKATSQDSEAYAKARKICIEESRAVSLLIQLYDRTFQCKMQSYLFAYCMYLTATVEVYEINYGTNVEQRAAVERFQYLQRTLQLTSQQIPGINRSLTMLKSHLPPQLRPRIFYRQPSPIPLLQHAASHPPQHSAAGLPSEVSRPSYDMQNASNSIPSNDNFNHQNHNLSHSMSAAPLSQIPLRRGPTGRSWSAYELQPNPNRQSARNQSQNQNPNPHDLLSSQPQFHASLPQSHSQPQSGGHPSSSQDPWRRSSLPPHYQYHHQNPGPGSLPYVSSGSQSGDLSPLVSGNISPSHAHSNIPNTMKPPPGHQNHSHGNNNQTYDGNDVRVLMATNVPGLPQPGVGLGAVSPFGYMMADADIWNVLSTSGHHNDHNVNVNAHSHGNGNDNNASNHAGNGSIIPDPSAAAATASYVPHALNWTVLQDSLDEMDMAATTAAIAAAAGTVGGPTGLRR